jgi:hypothetical protein
MIIRSYPKSMKKLLQGAMNLEGTNIKALLLDNSYAYDATDEFISDLIWEISTGGYARQTLTLPAGADTTGQATQIFSAESFLSSENMTSF